MIDQIGPHYKILEKLGEGGMGVVYKARDTQLDRLVALKFLPEHVSINDETKARFLQEAKAAAALNHAHICTIHGVEESGGTMFIVMEYVDGGTLRTKLPYTHADEALSVALQIAEALQEAHARGIVHRDIKADNVMLTTKDQVKVMDFGLAKLKGSLKLTRTSSTVGTLAYMAPEQIQGGEIDSRSDIFSFGALLFEMLTGKTPFRGEHEAAMVYSIVNEEPLPLEEFRQDISPLLSNLILKCLEKDPADRYQHMDDIVSELHRCQKKTSKVLRVASTAAPLPNGAPASSGMIPKPDLPPGAPPRRVAQKRLLLVGAAAVTLALFALVAWFVLAPRGVSVNPKMTARVLEIPFTQFSYPSLSPDGKWIAFPGADARGRWDIYYMHVSGGEPRKITSDATRFIQQAASISPDGSQIVYDRPNADDTSFDLFTVSALGGTSRKLVEGAAMGKWRPDGGRVGFIRTADPRYQASSSPAEFWTVNSDGSDLRREFADSLFVDRGGTSRFDFCWAPDGNSVAWIRSLSARSQVLVVHDLANGTERLLTDGNENIDAMAWTKDGRIIFSTNRGGNTNLWAIPASGGEPVQVTKGGGPDISVSISASGNELVYLQQQRVGHLWTASIDGSNLRQISFDERELLDPACSPDMKRVAFVMMDPDPLASKGDLYVMDSDGNNRRRLTSRNTLTRFPAWSPDGRRILHAVFSMSQEADTSEVKTYVVDADNPGVPTFAGDHIGHLWMDDDHILALHLARSYMSRISSGTTRPFFSDSVLIWSLVDRRTMVYYDQRSETRGWWALDVEPTEAAEMMNQTGKVVVPLPRGRPRKISSAQSPILRWTTRTTDAGELLQCAGDDKVRLLSVTRGTERLLPASFPGLGNGPMDVTRDGKKIVFVARRVSARLVLLESVFR